ncbi:HAD family hydrolase [Syntrophomonas erecta]
MSLQISLPGRNKTLFLKYLLLDMNGTVTREGNLIEGVKERVAMLKNNLEVYLLTADTFGSGVRVAEELNIPFFKVSGEQGNGDKRDFLLTLAAENTVAIGNGFNDSLMLQQAELSIAVIGPEGCNVQALTRADIVVTSILDGLDLLISPVRLIATLRG